MAKNKTKNLLGDVYDVLASNNDFITQKMFTNRHADSLEVDYDKLEIRLSKTHVLRLVEVN